MSSNTGKKSNQKGKSGEREFVREIYRLTDGMVELKRNLTQCRDGGDDLSGYKDFSIEVKRRKKVTDALVRDWWAQCQRNAKALDKVPVLACRADLQSWRVWMHPNHCFEEDDVRGCLSMDVELFAKYLTDPDHHLSPLSYH